MVTRTIDDLPVASSEAIALGTLLLSDANGIEFRATTAVIGGVHLFFQDEDDLTPVVRGRLTSPGRTVENILVTLTATSNTTGLVVTKTTTTNDTGNWSYDFTTSLARNDTYTIEAKVDVYLTATTTKAIASLSTLNSPLIATSTAKVGDTITVDEPDFSGSPSEIRYRYLRGPNYVIPGAHASVYTLVADDDADIITPQVQAVNAGGESQWFSANTIGPVSNKTSVLLTNPVIAADGTLGGRATVTSPGSASENATIKSDEWLLDNATIPSVKGAAVRYLAGQANGTDPTAYPDGSNHNGVPLTTSMYTGSNTYSFSVAPNFVSENDYIPFLMGAAGGNEGSQVFDIYIKHLSTNSALRFKMFAGKYRNNVLVEEVQMSKVGAAAGQELNDLAATAQAVNHWTLNHDFGEWLEGDYLVFRQKVYNTSPSSSNNYQWDARSGASYASLPIGPVQGIQKSISTFTSNASMAGKKLRLKRTFTNRNNEVVSNSNEITLEAATTQTFAPTNLTAPTIVAKSDRSNTVWYVDLGAWNHQPSSFTAQWVDNGVDIAGATNLLYTPPSSLEGHTITCRVTATNDVGSASVSTTGKTVLPAAVYYNAATGNDANDGLTEETAKQTTTGSQSIPSGATAIIMEDTGARLLLGSNRSYQGQASGSVIPSIGALNVNSAVDQYTDGYQSISNIALRNLRILSGDRGITQRQGSNWTLEDLILENVGWTPAVSAENCQGMFFYNMTGLTIRRCAFNFINSDALYIDTCNHVLVEDSTFLPVFTAEGDTIQTRADRTVNGAPGPHQRGFILRRSTLDMHSRKTASGKGDLVTNSQDYKLLADCTFLGNNFSVATDEGDNHACYRCDFSYGRKNSYSSAYSIGGYDNEPSSHNHVLYDNRIYDYNRALSWTGISVTGYTGAKAGRVDVQVYDQTIVKCATGMRIDRPTSGIFMGFVFHNVTKVLDRALTTLPSDNQLGFVWGPHYTYNGAIQNPPPVTTRATISGTREVGEILSGDDAVFDTSEVLTAFPSAVITRSYQWRRHKPMPKIAAWNQHMGWSCEYIDGATDSDYTIQTEDQGCRLSRVDRIHLTFTEAGVTKVVTAIAYDGTYPTSSEVLRTGDLATALPVLVTSGGVLSAAAVEGTIVLDFPALITGETRTLLNPSRAYDPYTGTAYSIDVNGDLVKGADPAVVSGNTYSITVRQQRGIDVVDYRISIVASA
ncbi:pectin lyase fold domain-containing protein [Rhizobium phage RHEph16]|uniref:Pectin lyase fold domain-containing protein n=1 Tax=Rhizobium phage RHEph16 TaxID=2836132 RepID=A0AAE8AXJ2_9CAUD|nr:pectin lyase fold domain-containing protein [Rhizobium phage RHEph16]QXV74348.1 pectin lyase fold domain-containing protein [Rhizobium phage RHEph16]